MNEKKGNRKRIWIDWKIGAKVIGIVVAIGVLITLTLLSSNYVLNVNNSTKNVGENLIVLGNEVVLRASDQVFSELKVLETLARTPSLVEAVNQANIERKDLTAEEIALLDQDWIDEKPSMAAQVREIQNNDLTKYLKKFIENNPDEIEVFATDVKGLILAMTDRTSDFLQSDEGWWQSAFAEGKGSSYIASVEFDESSNSYAMNLGVPVFDSATNKVIGILRGTIDVSTLIQTFGNVKYGETGNASLIDSDGNILYTTDPSLIMQPAPAEIMALFEAGQSGWKKGIDLDGHHAVMAYTQLTGEKGEKLHWNILMAQDQDEISAAISNYSLISSVIGLVVATAAILLSLLLIRLISEPLRRIAASFNRLAMGDLSFKGNDAEYLDKIRTHQDEIGELGQASFNLVTYQTEMVDAASRIANGDLTVKVNPRSADDALGNAFIKMTDELSDLVSQVTGSAKDVESSSAGLADASNQASRATEQISTTIQQMATGTNEFATTITHTSQSVEQMSIAIDGVARGAQDQAQAVNLATSIAAQISNTIHEIATNAQTGAQAASEAADTARTGAKTVEDTINGMNSIKSKVGISVAKVQEMGERSNQIGTIVQTIEDISSQTNLLALNAAIEAARAGEQGKGFAVVADEVRKLAERSSQATKEISDLINGIQLTVAEAVAAMNDGANEVESGVDRAGQSGVALQSILVAVEAVNTQVSNIAEAANRINVSAGELDNSMSSVSAVVEENTAATEEMSASSSEVTSAMELIASSSEETSASIQEVSASTEEMTAQVQEVNASAQELASLAETLKSLVTRFKLSEEIKD